LLLRVGQFAEPLTLRDSRFTLTVPEQELKASEFGLKSPDAFPNGARWLWSDHAPEIGAEEGAVARPSDGLRVDSGGYAAEVAQMEGLMR
jgi:hypothetical protein